MHAFRIGTPHKDRIRLAVVKITQTDSRAGEMTLSNVLPVQVCSVVHRGSLLQGRNCSDKFYSWSVDLAEIARNNYLAEVTTIEKGRVLHTKERWTFLENDYLLSLISIY